MPNRILRDWSDSYRFDGISSDAECLFIRLIMKADDFGGFHGDARIVDSICFPLGTKTNVARSLNELEARELVTFYHHAGRRYLTIANFGQRLRHTTRKFPDPSTSDGVQFGGNPPQSAAKCGQMPADCGQVRPEVEEKRSRIEEKRIPSSDDESGFEKFWESYPRKTGKGAARNAWAKAKLPEIDLILSALHKAKKSPDWLKERGAYIPHPATWLNQCRWEDSGMDYDALTQKRVLSLSSTPQEAFQVDEQDALNWIAENYEVKAGVPYRDWPQNVQAEYRNQIKQLQAA
jgi:hypothetical protein